jgi:hypothetical protein
MPHNLCLVIGAPTGKRVRSMRSWSRFPPNKSRGQSNLIGPALATQVAAVSCHCVPLSSCSPLLLLLLSPGVFSTPSPITRALAPRLACSQLAARPPEKHRASTDTDTMPKYTSDNSGHRRGENPCTARASIHARGADRTSASRCAAEASGRAAMTAVAVLTLSCIRILFVCPVDRK